MKIVKLDITEDNLLSGVDAVALVENPAHEEDFFAFKKQTFQSYNDYPESAVNAAKRALEWRDSHPEQSCGTPVGWARANQLAKRENISQETIARMASFARHLQYEDVPYSEGCGGLMVDAWGGRAGIEWASRKLEELKGEFAITVPGVTVENVDEFVRAILGGYFQHYWFKPEEFYNNSGINVSGLTDWLNEFPGEEPLYEMPWYVYQAEGNLNILGYQTKAFDMCPGAIATFNHLLEMNLDEDTKGMVRSAAVVADMVFLLEKQVIEHGIANQDQLVEAVALVEDFRDIIHEIDEETGMVHNVDYMQGHIDVIASYIPGDNAELIEIATNVCKMSKLEALVSGKKKDKTVAEPVSHNPQAFARQNLAMERKVIGPLMVPNKLIMRVDEEGTPYYVYFTEATIKRIADKFMKEGRTKAFNLEHDSDKRLNKVYITEAWIVTDPDADKSNAYGFRPRKGSWMGVTKIDNDYLWQKYVREGKVRGYSVEGFFVDKMFNQGTQENFVEPRLGESENEFISRCMGSSEMNSEFPDEDQRAAVCYAYWNK